MSDEKKMSFLEHLEELRRRLIICAVSVIVGMIICWFFREQILSFLLAPLYDAWSQVEGLDEPKPLNYSSMLEPFVANLRLSAVAGAFLSAPVVLYQLWCFISPGLYPKERRLAFPFVLMSTLLFVGGSIMAYSAVFPIGFKFFLQFASGQDMTELTAEVVLAPQAKGSSLVKEVPPTAVKSIEEKVESLIRRFFTANCAAFSVEPSLREKAVFLTVVWQKARCGKLSDHVKVRRDDKALDLVWQGVSGVETGVATYTARDQAGPGPHAYALRFPSNPGATQLMPVLMITDYLSLAIRMILAFGLIFELPILISFLAVAGIVNYRQLIRFSRYFFVIAVVVGAVLTPPDVISQMLLATPLMVLYGVSIIVAYLLGERPGPETK